MSLFEGYKSPYKKGDVFNNWTITGKMKIDTLGKHKGVFYEIECVCGVKKYRFYRKIPDSKMCRDCSLKEKAEINTKHNMSKTRIYNNYMKMIERCYDVKSQAYKNYGARGIRVCSRWLNSFDLFLKDMGEKPAGSFSIDRIDVNGNYEPKNCKWSSKEEQAQNRRNTVYVEWEGKKIAFSKLARSYGVEPSIAYKRLKRGWDLNKILNIKEPTK